MDMVIDDSKKRTLLWCVKHFFSETTCTLVKTDLKRSRFGKPDCLTWIKMASVNNRHKKKFRKMLNTIDSELTEQDWKKLVFTQGLPQKIEEQSCEDRTSFWTYMMNRPDEYCYNLEDPSDLFEDLESIGQKNLSLKMKKMYETEICNKGQSTTVNEPLPHHGGPQGGKHGPHPHQHTVPISQPHHMAQQLLSPQASHSTQHIASSHPGSHPPQRVESPGVSGSSNMMLIPPGGLGGAAGSHVSGLKSSEPLPKMPSDIMQRQYSKQEPPGPPGLQPNIQSLKPDETAMPTASPLPLQPESAQKIVGMHVNNPPAVSNQPLDPSQVSGYGQLMSLEPPKQGSSTVPPHPNLVSANPVQPASAQSTSVANQKSFCLKSNEPLTTMLGSVKGGDELSHLAGGWVPQPNSNLLISEATSLKSNEHSREAGTPDVPVRAMTDAAGGNKPLTLEYTVQPSSTPDNLRDKMEKLGLTHIEGLLKDPSSAQPLLALGQADTQKDHGPLDNLELREGMRSSLPADVVQDSASPLKSDVLEDAAIPEQQKEHDPETSLMDHVAPKSDSMKKLESSDDGKNKAEREIPLTLNFSENKSPKKSVKLRGYQKELAEAGLLGYSYIICAPTGSGKTITAAHICYGQMKKLARHELFKAIFIVPTRHLKKQQRDAFNDFFQPGQVASLGEGELFSDIFSQGNIRILMITAQVLVNAISQNQFKMSDVTMVIFDECHHTTLNHPYNELMKQYLRDKKTILVKANEERWPVGRAYGGLPQVIGLTASIGTGSSDDAHGHLVVLCANLDSFGVKVVSRPENVDELKEINRPPEADHILATPSKILTPISCRIIEILETVMNDIQVHILIDLLKEANVEFSPPRSGTLDYESWIANIRSLAEVRLPRLHICCMYLFRLNLALLIYDDLRAEDAVESMETFKAQASKEEVLVPIGRHCRLIYEKHLPELKELAEQDDPLSNPKLKELIKFIRKEYTANSRSKGIVLARTRFATTALLDFIQNNPALEGLSPGIKAVRIVGQNKEVEDGLTQAKQEAALDKFKYGNANLLVATDIVQEGLDVPACNIIIRYNFVSNEIGTVQSKGRARADKSKCYLIVERGSLNEARELRNRRRVIEMAQAIENANQMRREDWQKEVYLKQRSIVEEMEKKEAEREAQRASGGASDWTLLCNACRSFICKASDLERRLGNYTCLDESIKDRISVVRTGVREFRESRTVGIVKCAKCRNQLGQSVDFKRNHLWKPGYNLTPKSFIFSYRDGETEKTFAKWKKSAAHFEIAAEQ